MLTFWVSSFMDRPFISFAHSLLDLSPFSCGFEYLFICSIYEFFVGFRHCKYLWPPFYSSNMPSSSVLRAFVLAVLCLLWSSHRYLQARLSGHLTFRCHLLRGTLIVSPGFAIMVISLLSLFIHCLLASCLSL